MSGTADLLPGTVTEAFAAEKASSLWRDTLRNVLRQRSAILGLGILVVLALVALLADVIAPYGEKVTMLDLGQQLAKPRIGPCIHLLGCPAVQPEHIFGLDANTRDVFSRVVYGSRVSLQIGFLTVGFAIVSGAILGSVAGYAGGWVDNLIMRCLDVVMAFPSLLVAIVIVSVLGTSLINPQLAIGIVSLPVSARVMRASVLMNREQDFVTASRALGESGSGILLRRILPNALTPLVVQGTLGIGGAILDVAALSFLGLGAHLPTAEWGSMIGLERNSVFAAPHLIIFPGAAIVLTVLGFNLLGDGLRDALDPRLNR